MAAATNTAPNWRLNVVTLSTQTHYLCTMRFCKSGYGATDKACISYFLHIQLECYLVEKLELVFHRAAQRDGERHVGSGLISERRHSRLFYALSDAFV